jgi:hypothetical protein
MKNIKLAYGIAAFIIGIVALQGCKTYYYRSNYQNANQLIHDSKNLQVKPFLKAHLQNGDVIILSGTWQVDTIQNLVSGTGTRYNYNRRKTYEGTMSIPIDSVAIFETNTKMVRPEEGRIAALSIMAGVDVVLSIICLSNPKACFGSCPTFYLNEKDNIHFADAEGFSNAIAPSMEYADIDALGNRPVSDSLFSITMKNEALETHCVKDVKLLVYPINKDDRIYQSPDNDFYRCENTYLITHADDSEGDVTSLLQNDDRQERPSLADEKNLRRKEAIYLDFENVKDANNLGLIIDFRQTLMTTYFIYSAMGYMGDEVGDIFASIESQPGTMEKLKDGIKKELGNIDVYSWNELKNSWEPENGFYETGPIARNKQILLLKNTASGSQVKLKLVVNKGLWLIDYLALTNIKEKVSPVEISAASILNKGNIDDEALASIKNPEKYLISMPGSEYKFNFILHDKNQEYELFLYSKGYYLEWMRAHWLKDKDLPKLRQMVENPRKYLKAEAKNYKRYEQIMNEEFWNSKIDTKAFTYYEK